MKTSFQEQTVRGGKHRLFLTGVVACLLGVRVCAGQGPEAPDSGWDPRRPGGATGLFACAGAFRAVAASPQAQAAISADGRLFTSNSRGAWRQAAPELRTFFRDVTYAGGQFVAVGGSYMDLPGVIVTSTDGNQWQIRRGGSKAILRAVAYGSGRYVVVGDDGVILTSPNGIDWQTRRQVFDGTLASVAYGAGRFVAVGDGGVALVSVDGRCWTRHPTGVGEHLSRISFQDGRFIACAGQLVRESSDGVVWTVKVRGIVEP
jgi:hypothetical protein